MVVELHPGAVVAGRYRLDRLLGRGGMGQVWAVTHDVTHRVAALKLLNGPVHLQATRSRRFLREARTASAVNHPNVVGVHDFFELEDGTPVMIMDLLEGETLGRKLAREGCLSLETVAGILLPVVSAVGTAHARGIIHRDLKPENVFLSGAPDAPGVHVLDFGIAKLMPFATPGSMDDSDALTGTGGLVGTPCYMSPEQGFGEGTVDHRTDIWSLGVVLYESLAGSRPVDGANVGQVLKRLLNEAITPIEVLVPDLPRPVTELVGNMLQRGPEDRPRDLREVAELLARYTTVKVPAFGAAIGEAALPLDSSPTSAQISPRAVVRAAEPSDPIAATDPVGAKVTATAPSLGAVASQASGSPRLGSRSILALFVVFAIAALAAVWSLRSPARGPAVDSVPSAARGTASPLPSTPTAPGTAPPAEVVTAPIAEKEPEPVPPKPSKTGEPRRPARAAPAAPARAERPASAASAHRGGLVDEPPF